MPSLFLAHGSPMLAIEQTEYTAFLEQLGKSIRPKSIVIFTAHWETQALAISSIDDVYDTIYDFGGFRRSCMRLNIQRMVRWSWRIS